MFVMMQISEWRHGEVGDADLAGTVMIRPLAGQGSQTLPRADGHAVKEDEDEEEEEEGADFVQRSYFSML